MSIASPLMQPSPNGRRVGIRIVTFEACSGFTHVTARRIAQPPKATFVTRLQPCRLPGRAARQLPDQSTTLWVESSSTGDSRLRGALPTCDIEVRRDRAESIGKHVTSAVRRPVPFTEPGRQRRRQDCNLDGLAQPSDAAAARDCAVEKSRRKKPPVISKNAMAAAAKRPPRNLWTQPRWYPEAPFGPVSGSGCKVPDRKGQVGGIEPGFHGHYRIVPRHLIFAGL